jgi:cytoskeleton protein RodZ
VETLGDYLKSKREALNISLQEIAQVTRIRRSILEAIESNRYDLLPPKVFAQGFIKSYASYLGLDENEVIKRYSELVEAPDEDTKTAEVRKSSSSGRFFFVILLVAGLIAAAVFLLRMNPGDENADDSVQRETAPVAASPAPVTPPPDASASIESGRETAEAPAAFTSTIKAEEGSLKTAAVGGGPPSETAGQQQPDSADQQPPAVASGPPLTAVIEQQAAATAGQPPAAAADQRPADSAATPLVLKIVASQNTWMRIQSDKERPVEFILKGGQTRTVSAAEKFTLRIGNAGGVDLFLNEQGLGKPGKPGEVLQLTLPE